VLIKVRRLISPTTREEMYDSPWLKVDKEYLVLALFIVAARGVSV